MTVDPSVFDIQAGEGGEDSKLFVHDLARAYLKFAKNNNLDAIVAFGDKSKCTLEINGNNAFVLFKDEGGKHTVQRVPPTEKRGRRQTSIVTVAVMPLVEQEVYSLNMGEVNIETKRGSGPGGQHRNKTESMVVATHKPTGIKVSIDGRDQFSNKRLALKILANRIASRRQDDSHNQSAATKREQVGFGGRADKIRTYNFIDHRAVDHRSGKKTTLVDDVIYKGRFDLIK